MENNKNKPQDLDHVFKNQFGDFKAPKMRIEKRENNSVEEDNFDQAFRSEFADFEQRPDDKVWRNVQKELPLNLIWRNKLNQLSRIAAVLLIGLLVSVLIAQQPADSNLVDQKAIPGEGLIDGENNSDFVYDALDEDFVAKENSKTLFEDESGRNAKNGATADLKMDADPLAPLPSLAIQKIENPEIENLNEENVFENPMPIVTANGAVNGEEEEVLVRKAVINPAQ